MDDIKIYNDDSLVFLKKLSDNSIDCVITDPPYFIDKLDNTWDASTVSNDTKNSHIKHLPKGMKFSKQQSKDFYTFYLEMSKILYQKLKPGGYFLSFSSPRLYHPMAMAMDDAGFEIRDMINWVYTQTMPKGMSVTHQISKMKLSEDEKQSLTERYSGFKTPQIKSCFEPICVACKPIQGTYLSNDMKHNIGLVNFNALVGQDQDKIPANIITTETINETYDKNFLVKKPNKNEKGKYNTHVSVKPVQLMCHLLDIFTRPNSLVVDPFLGSGTTALACIDMHRRCIGIEKNKEYFDICNKRIEEIFKSSQELTE